MRVFGSQDLLLGDAEPIRQLAFARNFPALKCAKRQPLSAGLVMDHSAIGFDENFAAHGRSRPGSIRWIMGTLNVNNKYRA